MAQVDLNHGFTVGNNGLFHVSGGFYYARANYAF